MNIPFFEILILLFFLWPLIQRFLEKQKQANREGDPDFPPVEGPHADNSHQDRYEWEDAMKELEMIFTGQAPEPPPKAEEPPPAPKPRTLRGAETLTPHSRLDPNSVNVRRQGVEAIASQRVIRGASQSDEFVSDELVEELTASANPIYTSLDKAPVIEEESRQVTFSVLENIREPQQIREFYVLKEILDKPMALRGKRFNI